MTVLVVGDVCTDVVAVLSGEPAPGSDRPAAIRTRGGGAGANVAVHLARLGCPVLLAGCLGDDAAGTALAAELAAAGGDHATGFPAYERAMAQTVRQSHTVGPAVLRILVPGSRTQVRVMPQLLRVLTRLPPPLRRWLTSFGGGPARMLDAVVLKDLPTSGQPE